MRAQLHTLTKPKVPIATRVSSIPCFPSVQKMSLLVPLGWRSRQFGQTGKLSVPNPSRVRGDSAAADEVVLVVALLPLLVLELLLLRLSPTTSSSLHASTKRSCFGGPTRDSCSPMIAYSLSRKKGAANCMNSCKGLALFAFEERVAGWVVVEDVVRLGVVAASSWMVDSWICNINAEPTDACPWSRDPSV